MAAAAAVTLFRQGAASHADEPVPLPTAPSAGRIPARVAVPAHLSDLARFARVLRSEPGFDTADEVAWARRQCAGWSGAPGGLAVLLEMLMARATFPGPDPGDPPTAAGYRFPRPVPIALGSATARSREVCHVDLPGWDVVRVGQGGDVRLLVAWVVGLRVRWLKGEARLDCLCQLRTGEVSFFHDDAIQRIFPRAYYEHPPSLQAHALITKPSFGSLACLMVWAVGCFNVVADPGFRTIVIKSNHMVHRTMSSRSQTITVTGTNELKFLHGVRVGAALGTHASFDLRGVPLAARGLAPLAPVAVLPAPRFKQKAPVPFLRPLLGDAYRCVRCPVGPERSRLEARIRARCASADEATARAVEEVLARGLPCEAGRRAEHVLVLDAAEGPPGEGVGARTRRGRKRGREDVVVDEEAREEEAIAAWRGAFLRRVEESDSEHLKSDLSMRCHRFLNHS